jgi:signal transduction histidine kinase
MRAISDLLPRGNRLDEEAFSRRHQVLRWVLGLHVPLVFAFGSARGENTGWTAGALILPALCLVLCTWDVPRRVAASLTTVGLVSTSLVLVSLSDGAPAAYLHLLAILGFVGLYQDWIPLLLAVTTAVAVSGVGAPVFPNVVPDGQESLHWAAATGGAALLACTAQLLLWRASEEERRRTAELAGELARAQTQIEARESISELFVNLARRNQSLLDRQISHIVAMEERTSDPDALADLFRLDHLATRIRRNAESLLVLSGEEPSRRWGRPVPLPDVVRAAVAEVEDFRRCDLVIDEGVAVAGRAVADLAHLLAELVENGLQFSSPASRVRVASQARPDGGTTITIEDRGIGLSEVDRAAANDLLSRAPEVDLRLSKRLGLHVVSRLASRYGVRVRMESTAGGGKTVVVVVPAELLTTPDVGTAPASSPEVTAAAPRIETVAGRRLADPAPADRRPGLGGAAAGPSRGPGSSASPGSPGSRPGSPAHPAPARPPLPAAAAPVPTPAPSAPRHAAPAAAAPGPRDAAPAAGAPRHAAGARPATPPGPPTVAGRPLAPAAAPTPPPPAAPIAPAAANRPAAAAPPAAVPPAVPTPPSVAGRRVAPAAATPSAAAVPPATAGTPTAPTPPSVAGRPVAPAASSAAPASPAAGVGLTPAASRPARRPLVARPVADVDAVGEAASGRARESVAVPQPVGPAAPAVAESAEPVGAAAAHAFAEPAPPASGGPLVDPESLPVARRTAEVVAAPHTDGDEEPALVSVAVPPAPAAAATAPAAHPPATPAAGGLRRRVPQASLNPNMRQPADRPAVVVDRRSREEVRAMLSRFQAGQTKGRQDATEGRAPLFGGETT